MKERQDATFATGNGNGENRVGLIKSQTASKVSQKMAEAASVRPEVVGSTLNSIAKKDVEVLEAVQTVMETKKLLESGAAVEVIPEGTSVLGCSWRARGRGTENGSMEGDDFQLRMEPNLRSPKLFPISL